MMSGRADKKLRRLYKKDLAKHAEKEAHELATTFFNQVVKPKPLFFPLFLWAFLFKFFIFVPKEYILNINKTS